MATTALAPVAAEICFNLREFIFCHPFAESTRVVSYSGGSLRFVLVSRL
jgi:hypothetical protein